MAKDEKKAADAAEAPPKKNSKKLLILILALLLVLAAVGGAAAFLLLKKNHSEGADEEEAVVEKEKPKKKKAEKAAPPVYIAMDKFTVNLVPENGDQYLQVAISSEVEDASVGELLKLHMPKLRNRIVLILSSKKASDLATPQGKEQLALELRDSINGVIGDPPAKGQKEVTGPVKEVLFTEFIIQ